MWRALPSARGVDMQLTASVLVTGGSGFIGRYLVDALAKREIAVRVLTRGAMGAEIWPKSQVSIFRGDLSDASTLNDLCAGIKTVFHLAGHAHAETDPAGHDAEMHTATTVKGTENLLNACEKSGIKRFVFFSSVKAMGESTSTMLDESQPAKPTTFYGEAKLRAEKAISEFGERQDVKTCNLRLPIVYGMGSKGNLPRMIEAIDRNRFPPLPEVGNKRSMVHVADVVQAALLVADNDRAAGKTYIVTDERPYSTRQIYVWIRQALGRPIPRWTTPERALRGAARIGDMIGRVRGRRFMLDSQALDKLIGSAWYSSERIAKELGYRPTRDLESTLPEMVNEYRRGGPG